MVESIPDITEDSENVAASTPAPAAKDLKVLAENKSRQLIQNIEGSVIKRPIIAIEQIDGQMESAEPTLTFDLTISAVNDVDAYCSMEDNLCYGDEVDEKVLDISDEQLSEVRELNTGNTLYTFAIKVVNEEIFLQKLYERFNSWEPLYFGKPRGKLMKFVQRS